VISARTLALENDDRGKTRKFERRARARNAPADNDDIGFIRVGDQDEYASLFGGRVPEWGGDANVPLSGVSPLFSPAQPHEGSCRQCCLDSALAPR